MGNERFPFAANLETYISAIRELNLGFANKIKSQVGFPYSEATHVLNYQTEDAIERANKV